MKHLISSSLLQIIMFCIYSARAILPFPSKGCETGLYFPSLEVVGIVNGDLQLGEQALIYNSAEFEVGPTLESLRRLTQSIDPRGIKTKTAKFGIWDCTGYEDDRKRGPSSRPFKIICRAGRTTLTCEYNGNPHVLSKYNQGHQPLFYDSLRDAIGNKIGVTNICPDEIASLNKFPEMENEKKSHYVLQSSIGGSEEILQEKPKKSSSNKNQKKKKR